MPAGLRAARSPTSGNGPLGCRLRHCPVYAPSAAMSTETEYNIKEAAARLGWAGSTLRDHCSARTVPHHRRHVVKGIFFTDDDLAQIQAQQQRRQPPLAPRAGTQPLSDQHEAAALHLPGVLAGRASHGGGHSWHGAGVRCVRTQLPWVPVPGGRNERPPGPDPRLCGEVRSVTSTPGTPPPVRGSRAGPVGPGTTVDRGCAVPQGSSGRAQVLRVGGEFAYPTSATACTSVPSVASRSPAAAGENLARAAHNSTYTQWSARAAVGPASRPER